MTSCKLLFFTFTLVLARVDLSGVDIVNILHRYAINCENGNLFFFFSTQELN